MKKLLLTVAALIGAVQAEATPAWQVEARKAFGEQRLGIFVHWGLYSVYSQGEWYQSGGIRRKDYAHAKDMFYPSRFDARKWARTFKAAGAKYVTFTTRHHDGFSLFETKYAQNDYDVMHTPFKRDVTREVAEACRAEGLQINFYYSLMDWWRTDYPIGRSKYLIDKELNANADYASYHRFMLNQLEELLTNYGAIGCIWFDGEGDHRESDGTGIPDGGWRFDALYDLVHAHKTLVGNNNSRPVREKEDIQFFEMAGTARDGGKHAASVGKPLERCQTTQSHDCWGYRLPCWQTETKDGKSVLTCRGEFFSSTKMIQAISKNAAKGVNLLLNVGPRGDGELADETYALLKDIGDWMRLNGEAIYATTAGEVADEALEVVSTRKGDALYLHFLDPSVKEFAFANEGKVVSATLLATGASVPFVSDGAKTVLRPTFEPTAAVSVVKLVFAK